MTRYSSEFPKQPVHIAHFECGGEWDVYGPEIPPKFVICTQCHRPLQLAKEREGKNLIYRHI